MLTPFLQPPDGDTLPGMGLIRDNKASTLGSMARDEWDRGSAFFTPVLEYPATLIPMSAGVPDWAAMLTAIAEVGWVLHSWAVVNAPSGKPRAVPVFTRVG